jgi:hypothetical protein
MQGLQRRGLLIDQNEQQFVFKRLQSSLAATPRLALAHFALCSLIRRIERNVGSFKGWKQVCKLLKPVAARKSFALSFKVL